MKKIKKPKTLEEVIKILDIWVTKKDKEWLIKQKKDDLIMLHHGFGTWIRNTFGLWREKSPLRDSLSVGCPESLHPDSCSMIIIEEFWKHLKGKKNESKKRIRK